jgi:hypothetical protein
MAAQNWALASNGSTATSSDDLIPAWGGDKAIDGDNGTNWHSTNSSGHSLEVDFGQNRLLDKVEIRTARADSGYAFGYGVDYWNGSSWVSIVSGQNANNGAAEYEWIHTFSEVTASKIRLVTTGAVYAVVQEFRGWGEPPAPPTCDVAEYVYSPQDAFAVIGTIGECESAVFTFSPQDIDGILAETPIDLLPFEILDHCKMLNINGLGWGAPLIEANFGGGYGAGIIANQDYGLHRWSIASEFLPDKTDFQVTAIIDGETETQTYFEYVFKFFQRHTLRGNKPFIIKESRTALYYLVRFTMQGQIDFGRMTAKFFTSEGIAVEEARTTIAGFNFASDGSVTKDA